jgi:2-methylcitrate dehydratase PrpD
VLDTFTDAMVQRAPARELMKKVRRYTIDDGKVHGLDSTTDVEVETARGKFKLHVEHTPGSADWPMTDADRREKFLGCAVPVLGEVRAESLLAQLRDCATLADVGVIARAAVA